MDDNEMSTQDVFTVLAAIFGPVILLLALVFMVGYGFYQLFFVDYFGEVGKAAYAPLPNQYTGFVGTHIDPEIEFVCKDGTISKHKHRIGACYMHGGIVSD